MSRGRKNPIDKFRAVLFEKAEEKTLTTNEYQQLVRYRDAFTQSLEDPFISDTEMRDYLMFTYRISESQAYRDLANIRILLGNVKNAGKEWIRYMVVEGLKKQYRDADNAGRIKEAIMALKELAKYNRLDKEDSIDFDWDKIIPVDWEAVTDVTVLGGKPVENLEKEINELYKKYRDDIEVEDIEYKEVTEDE
ncbi:MAG: hypothetical protein PF489_13550 [Salinivirgaceae bacterium]|jgi:hypothetical protein|nr:hypothetical protein [Salinivirgaceae bacterium]